MRPTRTPLESRASLIAWLFPYAALAIIGLFQMISELHGEEAWQVDRGWVAIAFALVWIASVFLLLHGLAVFGSRSKLSARRERVGGLDPGAADRQRPDDLEFDLGPRDAPSFWLVKYLPRLREARRRMRPDVVPKLDLPFTDGPIDLESAFRPAPAGSRGERPAFALRSLLAPLVPLVLLVLLVGYLAASGPQGNADLRVWAVLGATYVVYSCLMAGWLWQLKAFPVIFLMAMTTVIMIVESWLAGWSINGHPMVALTLALILPATPILLALLIARFRDKEPGPEGETTSGRLLRIKRRLHSYAGRGVKVYPTPAPTSGDRSWND